MSLFGTIQLANNSLIATQLGLQVTGNNLANANTPGYLRQELVLTPAATQRKGDLLLGSGVKVQAIIQKTNRFLEERLRGATSDLANSATQENTYLQLEALVGELSDTDLSTSLSNFFNSINDIANQPESISVRNLAVLKGKTLAEDINRLDRRVREIRSDVNDQIIDVGDQINSLLNEIAELNVQIVQLEGGSLSKSDAVGLRDRRGTALKNLASIMNIRAVEQESGSVTVFSGGEFLVFEGTPRPVKTVLVSDRGLSTAEIRIESTDLKINSTSGKLAGLITSRDEILGGFVDSLDQFTKALIFEFNKVFSSGQGLIGHEEMTSEFAVDDTSVALDQTDLEFTPINGSFQVQVFNKQTGLTQTTDVFIKLNGFSTDTSLTDLAAELNAIDGISASISPNRFLELSSDSPNLEFAFAKDTSGTLAALGLNTFFSGTSSSNIGINDVIREAPAKFAASLSGIGGDSENSLLLAQFINTKLDSQSSASLADIYDQLIGETTQAAAVARAVADGFRVFEGTLEGQVLATSGVSLDEEAVNMITYQRAYQASARLIATISELLETLINL